MAKEEKKEKKLKRVLAGEVVSDKMDKTVVIKVTRRFRHPLLGKIVQKSRKYKVHDEKEESKVGDWVEVCESKPLSKTKHMVLVRVLRQAA
jgi:small subunit ribosomal protein S17